MRPSNVSLFVASLSCILNILASASGVQLSGNPILSKRPTNEDSYDSSEPFKYAPALSLHARVDPSSDTSAATFRDKPVDDDDQLTFESAVGKGRNLVKLLESSELASCDVAQSNFTNWAALSENGWNKSYQGKPKEGSGWKFALEKLKLSSDDQKNTQYDFIQSDNVTIDGKSYRSSGGSYSNVMNADGAIFALHSFSPRTEGALEAPPLDGSPGKEIVPLQSWADIAFLEWSDACKGNEQCMKGLKLIVKCHAQNNATDRMSTQALGGTDKWPTWPGKSFAKDSEQFAALMASPSGRGVAWLLLTHRQQLGNKYVQSVDLWSEKDGNSNTSFYTFRLEDHSQHKRSASFVRASTSKTAFSEYSGVSEQSIRVKRGAQEDQGFLVYDGNSTGGDYKLFNSDHEYTYDEAQKVGRYLVSLMQASPEDDCVRQSQWNFSDLSSNGWRSSTAEPSTSKGLRRLDKILSYANLPMDDDNPDHVIWEHNATSTTYGNVHQATNGTYDALYGKHAIILFQASSPVSESARRREDLFPPLKELSDVLWLQWESTSESKHTDIKDLRFVMVDQTTNSYTSNIARQSFGNTEITAYPGKTFEADSKELNAVLASPHGQGIVWLLSQNKAKLGSKTVESVQIWADEKPCLLFTISNHSSSNSSQTSTKSTKEGSNDGQTNIAARADGWDEAVSKGKRYLEMLKCGTGLASEFTSYEDLKTWGWIVESERQLSRGLDGDHKQAVEYLEASFTADHTWEIEDSHDVSTIHDETTYPASDGSYDNIYAPEFIISVTNLAPRKASEDQSFEGPFPKLEKQSDVMFLEYQRLMTALGKPLTGLKGLLRTMITNKETQRIVAKALGIEPGAPRRWPEWPGRDFNANSDEGAAILATPNGRAPVWLLGTHKEQLGHKSISKVKVFGKITNLYILFVFEEVAIDSSDDKDGGVPLESTSSDADKDITVRSRDSEDINNRYSRRGRRIKQSHPQAPPPSTSKDETKFDWPTAVEKGKSYLEMLKCGSGPQSKWTSYDDLSAWGWKKFKDEPVDPLIDETNVMEHLKIKPSPQKPQRLSLVWNMHKNPSQHNEQTYPETGGTYKNHYDMELIVAIENWSPENEKRKPGPLTELHRLSDVWFLEYSRLMAGQKKPLDNLKGILRYAVSNAESLAYILKAMGYENDAKKSWKSNPPVWPGKDFDADSDEMAALLASPNGRGVAWFLINHEQVGRKTVDYARVWYNKGAPGWMVLFVFKDLSEASEPPTSSQASTSAPSNSIEQPERRAIAARAGGSAPERYQQLSDKGKKLVAALKSEDECFAQSEFTKYTALKDWGWSRKVDTKSAPMKIGPAGSYEDVFELVGVPWDHSSHRWVVDEHDTKVEKDGKTYYPTGAKFANRFSPLLIIAMNNHGPAVNGKKRNPPVTGDPNPYPDLARQSDVLFLEYQRIVGEMNQPMESLKAIWRKNIANMDTREVCFQIAGDGGNSVGSIPLWPGKDFAADSDEFAALLASPNGVAVAYLLLQHRQQLGAKTVTKAKVWNSEFMLQVLFFIEERPETQESSEPVSKEARSLNSSSASSNFVEGFSKTLVPRALGDDEFNKLVDKGKSLVSSLQSDESCMAQSDWIDYKSLATWGWYTSRKPNVGPVSFFAATKQVYELVGASMENDMNHRAYDSHADKKEIDGVTYYPTAAEFDNRYNPSMIVAENIYGADYQGKDQKPPVTGDPNPFPKLRFWSDVTFLEYQKFMRDSGQDTTGLKAVWHRAIINPATRELAARFFEKDDWNDVPDWPGKDFTPGTDEFAALVGSDNGKGVVFLLLQYRKQLGSKTITKARVWKDHTLHILYLIDDTCADTDAPDRRVVRRADQPPPDSEAVDHARQAGRFLLMAQESDDDVLESCLSIQQSKFTELHQLEESGWMRTDDRSLALDEDSDEATFNSWLDMNLDLIERANHEIQYMHLAETTGSDGVVYQPTNAFYKNIFNEGAIAALNNASPWKSGSLQDPPIDGSKDAPFPPLKQWSDEVFLVYKEVCNGDPVKMKKLKGVLRHSVINVSARNALHEYLSKHGELENNNPKTWPGTLYKLDEDGFNVALGVSNGKGVAYLLATHREALGWKEIYQIRIFSVQWTSAYNILYYIRDHQEESAKRTDQLIVGDKDSDVVDASGVSTKSIASLDIRAPNDEEYEKARKKGSMLACQLYDPVSAITQSIWTDPKSLEAYGWTELEQDYRFEYNHPDNDIGPALKELGISVEGLDNIKHKYWHTQESQHDGKTYPPTYGWYQNVLNVKGGVIIAESNYGPDSQKDDHIKAEMVVPLKQYSDVVFLTWQKYAGDDIKNLKYVFRHNIYNMQTRELLYSIMANRGADIVKWPGTKISMIEKDAQAILGSANGHGVAYLLSQHKQQLGVKVIDHVTVFRSDKGRDVSLCFWIVDEDEDGTITQLPSDIRPPLRERSVQMAANRSYVTEHSEAISSVTASPQLSATGPMTWAKVLSKRFAKLVESCRAILPIV